MDQAALDWLERRGAVAGFDLDTESVAMHAYRQHSMTKGKGEKPLKFSSLDYQGVLTVRDPEAFWHGLKQGLGRAKAFGCGLMLIKRAD